MKFIRNLVDSVKPNFEKDAKWGKYHYAFEAFETFLFLPEATSDDGVHIHDASNLKRTMMMVIVALLPCLLFGMWNTGYQHYLAYGMETTHMENFWYGFKAVMPIVVVSYAVGLGVEFLFAIWKGHPVSEGYLVTGLLIPLTMPVGIPLWMVALAAIFCTLIGKEIFGGTGMNFMNPALLARAFLFFAFPAFMSGDIWVDLTPEAGQALVDGYTGATNLVYLDTNLAGVESLSNSFWGFEKGSIGETSAAACLLGAFILIWTGVGSWRIILSCFAGAWLMGAFLNGVADPETTYTGMHIAPHMHWFIGSFAFGAIFMATDPVSAAQTNTGKIVYGLLIGIFTVILRVFNPAYPEGVMLAILLMNVFAPLIDHLVVERHIKKRMSYAQ